MGRFSFVEPPQIMGLPKSYSVSVDGTPSYLTPTEMGRQELYRDIPFRAVFGLQRMEHAVSVAFASYAADLDDAARSGGSDTGLPFPPTTTRPLLPLEGGGGLDKTTTSRMSRASMILLDELEFDASVVTMPLVFAIVVAALSQFLVGYNTGVMNAPAKVVFPGHSTLSWSLAVAAFAVGGPFGALWGGKLADSRGRRGALLIDTWTFLLGGLIQSLAWDMFGIIVGRFVIGFASGFSSVLVPIYLGELAPPTLRGMLGTVTQFALVVGILASNALAFPLATTGGWRYLFAATPLLALTQLVLAPFLLESPRWLLGRDPHSLKARYIIKRLRGLRYDHEVEIEVGHYVMGGAAQRPDNNQTDETPSSTMAVLHDMWRQPRVRRLLISSLVLQMAQQFSGINAVFYYSTSFFEGVIDDPLVGTTIVGAVNVLATYAVLFLMDRCGRKTLLLWSTGGMFVSCLLLTASLKGYLSNALALLAVNLYVIFFEFGLGPIPWLIVAEMFSARYVATAMAASSQLNWACNCIVGFAFPYLASSLGPYAFGPFAMVLLATFAFAATALPETQGTTPEQLAAELTRTLSQTVVYQPHVGPDGDGGAGPQQIDAEWRKAMEQLQHEEELERRAGTYDYGFQPIASSSDGSGGN